MPFRRPPIPKRPSPREPSLWKAYEDAILLRRKSLKSWARRILDLRLTLGWSVRKFCHISGLDHNTVRELESGWRKKYYPYLVTIKKIRLLEAAYATELARFRRNPRKHNRLVAPYRRYVTPPIGPPLDPRYTKALGGVERFAVLQYKRHGRLTYDTVSKIHPAG